MKQSKVMPVGVDDFKKVREQYYFVDKTEFIREFLDGHSDVTLITRPRRFGKTLAMSMLYYFFTNENAEENRKLFDGTSIAEAGEAYMAEQGARPVVFLTLKDVKGDTWESLMAAMDQMDEYLRVERSLLYVAMTRARSTLVMLCVDAAKSRFIDEFKSEHMEVEMV